MAGVNERPVRVLLVDDDDLVRAGLRMMLDGVAGIAVVGEAADGAEVPDAISAHAPDVLLLDLRMPRVDGLTALSRLRARPRPPEVIVLTTFDSDENVLRALRLGASGFLLKDAPAARLLDAIRVAAAGDALLEPSITRRLIEQFARVAAPAGEDGPPEAVAALTARELEVLRLLARGMSNAEIAAELVLGEQTVKTHVARILAKLGLRDRVQAVVLAYETGFAGR